VGVDVLGDRAEAAAAAQERQSCQPAAHGEQQKAARAERDHDQQRPAEARRARRGRGDGERQHRDRVDHAERDDRQGDCLETDPDAAQPLQRPDLDQVVEPERQHDTARRGGSDGRQAARDWSGRCAG
jgi:hypothetical protein